MTEELTTRVHAVLPPVTLGDGLSRRGSLTSQLLLPTPKYWHSGRKSMVVWIFWIIWRGQMNISIVDQDIFTLSSRLPFSPLLSSSAADILLLFLATHGPGARPIMSCRVSGPWTGARGSA